MTDRDDKSEAAGAAPPAKGLTGRELLAASAAEARDHQERVVGAALAGLDAVRRAADVDLAAANEEAAHLPKQGPEELGPLWPGASGR